MNVCVSVCVSFKELAESSMVYVCMSVYMFMYVSMLLYV